MPDRISFYGPTVVVRVEADTEEELETRATVKAAGFFPPGTDFAISSSNYTVIENDLTEPGPPKPLYQADIPLRRKTVVPSQI